jgi:hypothetical protein
MIARNGLAKELRAERKVRNELKAKEEVKDQPS